MNESEKEFIPYKQALELKELGFDEPCLGYYTMRDSYFFQNKVESVPEGFILAPTYRKAFRFFREKYSLHHLDLLSLLFLEQKMNYEEAELECLKKLIEIVKNSSPTN